jgi:hypothetical protein
MEKKVLEESLQMAAAEEQSEKLRTCAVVLAELALDNPHLGTDDLIKLLNKIINRLDKSEKNRFLLSHVSEIAESELKKATNCKPTLHPCFSQRLDINDISSKWKSAAPFSFEYFTTISEVPLRPALPPS